MTCVFSDGMCSVTGCVQWRDVFSDGVCSVTGCVGVLMFSVILKVQQMPLSIVHS